VDTSNDSANCGACGSSCNGAECNHGACLYVVAPDRPAAIMLDQTHVYWLGAAFGGASSHLSRVAKDGTGMQVLSTDVCVTGGAVACLSGDSAITGLAVDDTSVYWTSTKGIARANTDGTSPQLLLPTWGAVTIRVDTQYLFLNGLQLFAGGSNGLGRASKVDGSGLVTVPEELAALDEDTSDIYYAPLATGPTIPANTFIISRIGKDGSNQQDLTTVSSGGTIFGFGAIAVEPDPGQYVFWVSVYAGGVYRCNKDGTGLIVIAPNEVSPFGIVTDGTNVYWIAGDFIGGNGMIRRASVEGTGLTTLVDGNVSSGPDYGILAVDETSIYFATTTAIIKRAK
jgi:hypothetical protein